MVVWRTVHGCLVVVVESRDKLCKKRRRGAGGREHVQKCVRFKWTRYESSLWLAQII